MKRALAILSFLIPACVWGQVLPRPSETVHRKGTYRWTSEPETVLTDMGYTSSPEAYELDITRRGVSIRANSEAGLFYGRQTLAQIREECPDRVQCLSIRDVPCLPYRGFMLDVSRHFFPKEFILKQIDILSSFKINVLHLHLVDTGGWRIEIRKYQQLTEQTAWRTHCDWQEWQRSGAKFCPQSPDAYGGYYTQDDIREIIAYAAAHFMEVIPEIDMPGHSSEVLSVMPELLCGGEAHKGAHEMCLGNDKTYQFCQDVLDEVMELFPSRYIHIGGDECGTRNWAGCPLCREMMEREGIDDVKHLQSCFTRRMEQYVKAHGKTIIGWDEMLDGRISDDAAIMSWHEDPEGRQKIVDAGHRMIISSEGHFYLDYYQDWPGAEPLCFGGYTPLRRTYSFDPFEGLTGDGSLVMGLQCNLWTEAVKTPEHAEHMMYPRVLAMAETAWSGAGAEDYDGFSRRVTSILHKLEAKGCHPFRLEEEHGPREEAQSPAHSIAVGKKVTFARPWSGNFEAMGEGSLTDGRLGDWGMNGLRWMGFDAYMDVTVDLGEVMDIHSVRTSFMQNAFTSMFIPEMYEILTSTDGVEFKTLSSSKPAVDKSTAYTIEELGWDGEARARYIQVKAAHPSGWCWLMCDEIIVR